MTERINVLLLEARVAITLVERVSTERERRAVCGAGRALGLTRSSRGGPCSADELYNVHPSG